MAKSSPNVSALLKRHVALPTEHGSWVFLLNPLSIGIFTAGQWKPGTLYLIVATLAAFLLRQPITILTKVFSHRRTRQDLSAAWFWMSVYTLFALLGLSGLLAHGLGYLLILVIPGLPVFLWHLYLVSKRAERHQAGVEIIASGVLALSAPAAYWTGTGTLNPMGWLLWILIWLQSAASIVYAYLRLEQRKLTCVPPLAQRIRQGSRAILYATFNLLLAGALSFSQILPPLLPMAYLIQWLETVYGVFSPAIGVRPTAIGVRQLIISFIFTLVFILTWRLG